MKALEEAKLNKWKSVSVKKLIYPLFVKNGRGVVEEIPSMPGVYRFSPDTLISEVANLEKLGLEYLLIFGIPKSKDWQGSSALEKNNVVGESVRLVKRYFPQIKVITDICLCAYTSHGHCGVIEEGAGEIDNVATLKALSEMALLHAQVGADYVAPSAMADTQVQAIRRTLDSQGDRKSTRLNSSHTDISRMPSSA